jgi:undecaprenyl-diphosphatase
VNKLSLESSDGLHSAGWLAKFPAIGITMVLIGGLTFGVLAYQLKTDQIFLAGDITTARMFRAAQVNAPWSLMEDILFGAFVGKELVAILGTCLGLYFLYKRFWRELAMVVFGLGGGVLLWYVISLNFDRPRPVDHLDFLEVAGPSFPSAPAVMAILSYGLLAYLLIPRLTSVFWKWLVALLSILAIVATGLSSLLFGIHYLTDVIAGYGLGLAWAGLVYTLVEMRFQAGSAGERGRSQKAAPEELRTPGLFKRQPIVAVALILFGCLCFAALGYNISAKGGWVQVDESVYKMLLVKARDASPTVNDIMLFGFFLGKQAVQWIVMILSIYFLYERNWLEFAMLQISVQGGGVLKNFLIDYFARPRPPEQLSFVTTTIPSFPSGHALGTVICYGFLAYLLVPRMPSRFWKWMLSAGILALVLFEGFSRIFHGNHYLSDVLAAFALGLGWVVLVCSVLEWIFLRDPKKNEG